MIRGISGTYETYAAYLASDEWQWKRRQFLAAADGLCEMCVHPGIRATEIHHVTYRYIGQENGEDVICLCADCHNRVHGGWAGIVNRLAYREKPNNTPYATEVYYHAALRNARRRGDIDLMKAIWEVQCHISSPATNP